MKKILRKSNFKLLIFLISVFPMHSFSCEQHPMPNDGLNLILDYDQKEAIVIGNKENLSFGYSKCEKSVGKYIRFALGAEGPALFSNFSGFFYESVPNLGVFEIKNSVIPFHFDKLETLLNNYRKNQKKLESCLDIIIKDLGNEKMELLEGNSSCNASSFAENNSWVINSGICAFKINKNSNFKIGIKENTNCLDKDFLKREEFWPGDIKGRIRTEIGELDSDKKFKKLKAPQGIDVNLNIKSGNDFFKNKIFAGHVDSESLAWVIPDILFKDLKIIKAGENITRIDFSLLVNNDNCENICIDGLCTSPCNFLSPLAGEVKLSEINSNGVDIEIGNIFIGEVLRPNWKGILNDIRPIFLRDNSLTVGEKYKIELEVNDPYLGYLQYKKEIKRLLGINRGNFNLSGSGIPDIGAVNSNFTISDIGNGRSDMDLVFGANYEGALSVGNTNLGFSKLVELKNWPPVYGLACNKNYTNCKIPEPSNLGKVSVVFEVIGEKDGVYEIRIIESERKSKVIDGFKVKTASWPKIISGNQEF